MWTSRNNSGNEKKEIRAKNNGGLVAVAIDKDKKNSHSALKWAIDHLLQKGQTLILIHVKAKSNTSTLLTPKGNQKIESDGDLPIVCKDPDPRTKDIFLPFRCLCTCKDIPSKDVILEESDVAKALIEYVTHAAIEVLVLGAPTRAGFLSKFKGPDVPGVVSKNGPDFCSIYVISKMKISSMRSASRPAPANSPLRSQLLKETSLIKSSPPHQSPTNALKAFEKPPIEPPDSTDSTTRSPFSRKGNARPPAISIPDTDISFVSYGARPSTDRMFPDFYDVVQESRSKGVAVPRLSNYSDYESNSSYESIQFGQNSVDMMSSSQDYSDNDNFSNLSSSPTDEAEAEMRRLKLELKQTMEMYSTARKEALTAKQKAKELQLWKVEEERRIEEARLAEESALAIAEQEKAKSKAAIEAAEAALRIAEIESEKRVNAEMEALKESSEKKKALDALANNTDHFRYRKYTIEEIESVTEFFSQALKIGEGGYGPVYEARLDHTPVAIKVLRPDAAQGRSQFQQEVEVLSCIRHPNMVLLLGACPEYGCLVYEFMSNGSLDDCLFKRGNNPPLSWQLRFRIAAEIATALLFLHQTKPEPIVHRDLKPGNILLDHNYVSKISDVGLARLVPPSVVDAVTQYRMTSTAGTFCYIDPEYQQTGMLGVKSDIYSLGIMLLQIITAKPPMGLNHHVQWSIENGTFAQVLDSAIDDWPIEEALCFAKIALNCSELRRKDRPDLGKVVLPELNRLRALAEETMPSSMDGGSPHSRNHSQVSLQLEHSNCPNFSNSDDDSKSR